MSWRVVCHSFQQVPGLVAVDLVEASEQIRLAVATYHVTGWQYFQKTLAVTSFDNLLFDDKLFVQEWI